MWKIVKRILIGLLSALLLFLVFIGVSIPVAGIGGAERVAALTNTTIPA